MKVTEMVLQQLKSIGLLDRERFPSIREQPSSEKKQNKIKRISNLKHSHTNKIAKPSTACISGTDQLKF